MWGKLIQSPLQIDGTQELGAHDSVPEPGCEIRIIFLWHFRDSTAPTLTPNYPPFSAGHKRATDSSVKLDPGQLAGLEKKTA